MESTLEKDPPLSPRPAALAGDRREHAPLDSDGRTVARRRPRLRFVVAAAVATLAGLPIAATVLSRSHGLSTAPVADNETPGVRIVRTVQPGRSDQTTLTLPANIDAFQTTLLYARVSGYLHKWHVDLGDVVKTGQTLAEIDTPELDQELLQVRANLSEGKAEVLSARAVLKEAQAGLKESEADIARSRANCEYAESVLRRSESLQKQHTISDQELDASRRDQAARQADLEASLAQRTTREAAVGTAAAKVASREATVAALEANVRRLERLQDFKTIVAPFDGVVTRRRAEVGLLVTAGSTSSSPELFAIAQTDMLRIRLPVPQALAANIEIGQRAEVQTPERPDRMFPAKVARTSKSIDPASRTLMVELELPNSERLLLPGAFAQVVFPMRRATPVHTIPATTLLNRPEGLRVALVTAAGTVRLQVIKLGRDYGSAVEVASGISGGEQLIINPPDDLADNEHVTVAAPPAPEAALRKSGT